MQDKGLETDLVVDRDTASRLGVQMSTIDNVLYDAFGQRQVSTMYTQLNQYHVILEVQENFQLDPSSLSSLYVASSTGTEVPLSTFVKVAAHEHAPLHRPSGAVSGQHDFVQSRAGRLTGRRGQGHQPSGARISGCPRRSMRASRAPPRPSRPR